jgi:hypothetical protein
MARIRSPDGARYNPLRVVFWHVCGLIHVRARENGYMAALATNNLMETGEHRSNRVNWTRNADLLGTQRPPRGRDGTIRFSYLRLPVIQDAASGYAFGLSQLVKRRGEADLGCDYVESLCLAAVSFNGPRATAVRIQSSPWR